MFYVIADAEQFGLRLTPDEGADIVRITEMIKAAANEQAARGPSRAAGVRRHHDRPAVGPGPRPVQHATERRDRVDRGVRPDRPATWTGAIDRSPCGTGTSAKMATLHARGELRVGDTFRHEGILGTVFTGAVVEETAVGEYRAIVPTISGKAWITGFATYVVDPTDPFPRGFTIGDIWAWREAGAWTPDGLLVLERPVVGERDRQLGVRDRAARGERQRRDVLGAERLSGQAAIVDGPGFDRQAADEVVVYVPATWLQSAVDANVPSDLNSIVYFDWSHAGTTPWNAGTFVVSAVSCQFLPVQVGST